MLLKHNFAPLAVSAVMLSMATEAFACRCKTPDLAAAYADAELVILGTVSDYIPAPEGMGGTAVVSLRGEWKQSAPSELVVNSVTSCYFDFVQGTEYLLFLKQDSNGLYYTTACQGNLNAENDSALVERIESIMKADPAAKIPRDSSIPDS